METLYILAMKLEMRFKVSEQRYIRFNRTGTDVFGRVLRETDSGETVGKGFLRL